MVQKVHNYLDELGINEPGLEEMSNNAIKKLIEKWDTDKWGRGISEKSTLRLYGNFKRDISEESWFCNGWKYSLMMRARSDTLRLGWRVFGAAEAQFCKACRADVETLKHFVLECLPLEPTRTKCLVLQRPREEDEDKILASFLLLTNRDGSGEDYIDVLAELWNNRNGLIEQS